MTELQVKILLYLYKYRPGFVRENDIIREIGEGKAPIQSDIAKSLSYLAEKGYIEYDSRNCKIFAKGIDYLEVVFSPQKLRDILENDRLLKGKLAS